MNVGMRLFLLAQEHAPESTARGGDATRLVLPEIDELIWGAIAFGILFVVLAKVAFPALRKGLRGARAGDPVRARACRAGAAREPSRSARSTTGGSPTRASEADRIIREATEAAESVASRARRREAEEEARQIVEKARTEAPAGTRPRVRGAAAHDRRPLARSGTRVIEQELSEPERAASARRAVSSRSSGRTTVEERT